MKNKRMIFATTNEGKMREIRMIMADLGLEILSLKDLGIKADIEENGKTFVKLSTTNAEGSGGSYPAGDIESSEAGQAVRR